VRVTRRGRRDGAHLVTEAHPSKSADIAYRERRYLIMMGIRVVCFVAAVIVFAKGGGWLTAIPAVGAIAIPYFAVVFANGGREPSSTKGFRAYEPNLPVHYRRPDGESADAGAAGHGPADPGYGDGPSPPGGRDNGHTG
jgi:hypothetical protein